MKGKIAVQYVVDPAVKVGAISKKSKNLVDIGSDLCVRKKVVKKKCKKLTEKETRVIVDYLLNIAPIEVLLNGFYRMVDDFTINDRVNYVKQNIKFISKMLNDKVISNILDDPEKVKLLNEDEYCALFIAFVGVIPDFKKIEIFKEKIKSIPHDELISDLSKSIRNLI